MAAKRQRPSGSWEFIIRRKGMLPKPVSLTFDSEAEGDAYCARLEAVLDRGIVPPELQDEKPLVSTIVDALRAYQRAVAVSASDKPLLATLHERLGSIELRRVDYQWAESWIRDMKRVDQLSPSSIRHYVGALARCFDWLIRQSDCRGFPSNPLRQLPKRYATYSDSDVAALRVMADGDDDVEVPEDISRDRRLVGAEEVVIRGILAGGKPAGRQRALSLHYQAALELLFDLALETAMRMREMYTLTLDQVDIDARTVFLDRTKNGSRRQVPLTTVALAAIERYRTHVKDGTRGMGGFSFETDMFFPWWDRREDLAKVTSRLSRQYARIFDAAGCPDLVFHDLRHEATSRFFERTRLSDLQIAKITGHKDPRMLARYANLRGSDLADQLW